MSLLLKILTLLAFIVFSSQIMAQDSSIIIYNKDYFKTYNITNAADAIKRIPGVESFVSAEYGSENLDPGANVEKRGFGSSGTQILINGVRQSSKSNDIIESLKRISSSALIQIEIIRGSKEGLDVRSDGIIVNVIADTSSLKSSGTWSIGLEQLTSGNSKWSNDISWSKRLGKTDLVLGLKKSGWLKNRVYNEFHNTPSKIELYRKRENFEYESAIEGTFNLNTVINKNNTIRINGLMITEGSGSDPQTQLYYPPEDIKRKTSYKFIDWDRTHSFDSWEVGGDWEYKFNPKNSVKVLAVLNEDNLNPRVSQYENSENTSLEKQKIGKEITDRTESERILRASFRSVLGEGSLEYGAETAYNKLDRSFELFSLNENGQLSDSGLYNSKGVVEEDRYETFISYNFPINEKIRLETALNYEWSEISQSGDILLSREFQYWKPRFDLKWDYQENRQMRLRIERAVGQINFDDFIASYNIFEERIIAGNPDLKPSTSWEIEITHEQRLKNDGGVITFKMLGEQIDGPVERIPIGSYAAVGNLGTGEKFKISLDSSLRINKILSGGVLGIRGYYQHTQVIDPLTLIKRDLAWLSPWGFKLTLRQDLNGGKFNWSASVSRKGQFYIYDPYLYGRFFEDAYLNGEFNYKINPKLTLRVVVSDMLTGMGTGRKTIYNGFKSDNNIYIQENFKVKKHSTIKVELKGTF